MEPIDQGDNNMATRYFEESNPTPSIGYPLRIVGFGNADGHLFVRVSAPIEYRNRKLHGQELIERGGRGVTRSLVADFREADLKSLRQKAVSPTFIAGCETYLESRKRAFNL